MTLHVPAFNPPPVYGYQPRSGLFSARHPKSAGDCFEPQFGGKRLQGARSKSVALMLMGLLLGGGTAAYAAMDSTETSSHYGPAASGTSSPNVFENNIHGVAENARQTARALVPPASGRTAPDVMLRQTFCDYLTGISREIAQFNNESRKYLQQDNIADCFPEVVFDRTAFSDLMWRVYEGDGWHSIEHNYDEALEIIFGNESTRLSEHDKKILLNEARKAFETLEESDTHGGEPGTRENNEKELSQKMVDRIRKSNVMLALIAASAALLGIGLGGTIVFGVAEGADKRIQLVRTKRKAKRRLKNL